LEYMPYEHLWALAMEALMRSDRIIW
jgi:hypothetical protein